MEASPETGIAGENTDMGDARRSASKSTSRWVSEFNRQQREIIKLWDACSVPLVHRTYFFLLFKGKKSDFVYMEVELRRLYFLREAFSRGSGAVKDGQPITLASWYCYIISSFHTYSSRNLYIISPDPILISFFIRKGPTLV